MIREMMKLTMVPLGFLAILPLVWAALRRGPRETATVGLILTGFAIWGTTEHAGPFGQIGLNESFVLLLTFMISVSVLSLALSAEAMFCAISFSTPKISSSLRS